MAEDKLTRNERIRLESFAQAAQSLGTHIGKPVSLNDIITRAEVIEAWLVKSNPN